MKVSFKRFLAVLLTVVLFAQPFGALGLISFAETDQTATEDGTMVYTDDFNSESDVVYDYFKAEPRRHSGLPILNMPEMNSDGTFYLEKGDSLAIYWREIPNIAQSGVYTLSFDVKVTDFGTNDVLEIDGLEGYGGWYRELYVALGGYWDSVMIGSGNSDGTYTKFVTKNSASDINSGKDVSNNGSSTYQLDRNYSVEIVWDIEANTITSSITSPAKQSLSITGTRTYTESDESLKKGYEDFWALRCEDGAIEISGISFSDGTNGVSFPRYWSNKSTKFQNWTAFPHVENGVINLTTDSEISFNWLEVAGIDGYSATDKYVFEFDFKVTDSGNGAMHNSNSTYTRILYTALGGYYDLLSFNDKSGKINTPGSAKLDYDPDVYLNKMLHFKVEWQNGSVKMFLSDEKGQIMAGSRTVTYDGTYANEFSMRCEDGALQISNFSFTNGSASYSINDAVNNSRAEISAPWTTGSVKFGASKWAEKPYIDTVKGVMMVLPGTELTFDWTKVEGVKSYSTNNRYVFKYDMKITDYGSEDNSVYQQNSTNYTRILYNAFGGYYDLLSVYDKNEKIYTKDSSASFVRNAYLNKTLHVEVEWFSSNVTVTVTDSDGKVILSGSRTVVNDDNYTKQFSMRCEDGAVEMDNFVFAVTEYEVGAVTETPISIPDGKDAVYENDFVYNGKETAVWLGDSELFKLTDTQMRLCACTVKGTYSYGTYHVKVTVSPVHKIVLVEITLPDGGTVRRADSAALPSSYSAIKVLCGNVEEEGTPSLVYVDSTVEEYMITEEPVYEGFGANVFNLVTSFTDARYDRAFVWTALESFIGDEDMAVKYRAAGETAWTYKVAERCEETDYVIDDEDYFKVDISGLTANTRYEYKIGKFDSGDDTNDWSKSYFFTTEKENVDNFTFIAIGDTQSTSWSNMKYAQAAIDKAFSEVENPAFILHTGDVGQTYYNENADEYTLYLKALGEYGATTPHFATIGNHDKISFYFDTHFNHPNNGENAIDKDIAGTDFPEEYLKYLGETVYSYDYGNAHFICLNTGMNKNEKFMEAQRAWLTADLEANRDAEWTIILQHQNVYNRYEPNSVPWLADVIEAYGVDLLVQGDTHLVSRTYPIKDGKIVTKTSPDVIEKGIGTVYTTISSTSSSKDPMRDPNVEEMLTVHRPHTSQPTYTVYNISGNKLTVVTKQVDGLVLDSFTIVGEEESVTEIANGTCGVNTNWVLTSDGVLTISGNGDTEDYLVSITKDQPYRAYQNQITKVVIEDGVTSIGRGAFYGFTAITEVVLPESLIAIHEYAFFGCTGIKTIDIPANTFYIGMYAFRKTGLTEMTFANAEGWMFADGTALDVTNVKAFTTEFTYKQTCMRPVSENGTVIANGVFGNKDQFSWTLTSTGLLTVSGKGNMPKFNVNTTPWYGYRGAIRSVVIEEGITSVGRCSFHTCRAITSVTLPESLETIAEYAFYNCQFLTEATIPANVTRIEIYAFRKCFALKDVTFTLNYGWTAGDAKVSATELNSNAADMLTLVNYTKIWTRDINAEEEVLDPNYVTGGACNTTVKWSLTYVDDTKTKMKLTISGTGAMPKFETAGTPWYGYLNDIVEVEVCEGITEIGRCAFYGLKFVKVATIADTVTSINDYAFSGCFSLKSIEIPESVTFIAETAFTKTGVTL